MGNILGGRVRYFTDGAVIGNKEFVNEAFSKAVSDFGKKEKTAQDRCEAVPKKRAVSFGAHEM